LQLNLGNALLDKVIQVDVSAETAGATRTTERPAGAARKSIPLSRWQLRATLKLQAIG
jgi:hypothetical protein